MTTFPTATSVFASAGTSAVAGTFPENKTSSYLAHPSPTQNFPPESSSTLRSQPPDDFGGGFNKAAQIGTAIGVVIGGLGLIAIIVFGFKTVCLVFAHVITISSSIFKSFLVMNGSQSEIC